MKDSFFEEKRLVDLKTYELNGYPQEELESILKLTSTICGTSISLVNIIDESHQKTIATYGDWNKDTISRHNGLCDRVVNEDNIVVYKGKEENPELGSRLSEDDEEEIGFYAGMPLKTPKGYNIGALCIIDSEPIELTPFQKESLQTLAKEVMARIHLHKQNRELERYSIFLNNTADIFCIIDPDSKEVEYVNTDVEKELGFLRSEILGVEVTKFIEPDQFSSIDIENWFSDNQQQTERCTVQVQLKSKENEKKWFQCIFTYENDKWFLTARNITEHKNAKEQNTRYEEKFKKIANASSDLLYEYNPENEKIIWSDRLTDILGYPKSDRKTSFNWWAEKLHPEDADDILDQFNEVLKSEESTWTKTYRFKTHDGSYKYVLNSSHIDRDKSGSPVHIIGALSDISDLRESELQQKRLHSRLKHANHMAELGYWELSLDDGSVFWSDEIYFILNTDKESTTPSIDFFLNRIDAEDKVRLTTLIDELTLEEGIGEIEHKINLSESESKYLYHRGELEYENGIPNRIIITTQDITDRKEKELQIMESLKEKETLLSEIHHRVKNNLAIISGLLEMNSSREENSSIDDFIKSSQMRIQSIAKIHEKLYESKSFTHISFQEYLSDLLNTIESSVQTKEVAININSSIEDIKLNINQAIPCGLIFNELIMNSVKHAFTDKEKGTISIKLKCEDEQIKIIFKDDGNGLPDDFNIEEYDSLGMTLIRILCQQLEANLSFNTDIDGFECNIEFNHKDKVRGSASGFI